MNCCYKIVVISLLLFVYVETSLAYGIELSNFDIYLMSGFDDCRVDPLYFTFVNRYNG